MEVLIKLGKRRTILISISILLVSMHTIYFYHITIPEIETKKIIQQVIRFVLTIALLVWIYKGNKLAKNVALVLFILAILAALVSLSKLETSWINKIPLAVMIFVYSLAVLHFGLSRSFKAFSDFQNSNKNE